MTAAVRLLTCVIGELHRVYSVHFKAQHLLQRDTHMIRHVLHTDMHCSGETNADFSIVRAVDKNEMRSSCKITTLKQ